MSEAVPKKNPLLNAAERILRPILGRPRASAIIGDLLETHPNCSNLRLSLAIAQLLFLLTWRSLIAIPVAAIAGLLLAWVPFAETFLQLSLNGYDSQQFALRSSYFIAASMLLWIAGTFSLIRYGWHCPVAGYSLSAALLSVVTTCSHSLPHAKPALTIAITAFLLTAFFSASIKRSLMTLAPAILAGSATTYLLAHLPLHLNGRTPGFLWILLSQLLVLTTIESAVLSLMQRILNDNPQPSQLPTAE